MGPVEALELALAKEEEAVRLYEELSAEITSAKETFTFLKNEEYKHKLLLEKKISQLKAK